jgi:hypothetical protein
MTDKVTVTADDLLKSIQALETKVEAKDTAKEPAIPQVETVQLAKSTVDAVKAGAAAATKQALDVSDTLSDIVGLIGKHNDDALETLQKSVNSCAERDLAIVKVITDLKKSIDVLKESVDKFGEQPVSQPRANKGDVLQKSVGGDNVLKLDPIRTRAQISNGLQVLAKSLRKEDPKFSEVMNAAIKFEATGVIEDRFIAAAQKALAAPAA